MVINLHVPRLFPQPSTEFAESFEILAAEPIRIDQLPIVHLLQAAKLRQSVEGEVDLFGGQQMKQYDLVSSMAKVLKRSQQTVQIVEAIGEDDHHPPSAELVPGQVVP